MNTTTIQQRLHCVRTRRSAALMKGTTVLLMVFGLIGCAEGTDEFTEDPTLERPEPPAIDDALQDKIRNGSVTTERPEVGRIGGCTATLVAPDVAITAAHCLGYGTRTRPGQYRTLTLKKGNESRRFTVNRYRSYSSKLGANDIALLGLSTAVPSDFAQPAPISARVPVDGTSLTVYGYGCTRIGRSSDGRKRKATYEQGERSYHLCPGDSGGPVFNDETGAVLRINSGYRLDRGKSDIYGIVPGLYDRLRAQISDWSTSEPPDEIDTPEDDDLTICGRDADVFENWTCTADRTHRHRCLPGGAPVWEACEEGCVSREAGSDDVCKRADSQETCGDTYRKYTEWICATDDVTILRCDEGRLEFYRCENGCLSVPGAPDRCSP